MKKLFLLLTVVLMPLIASAYDIAVKNADGVTIYYNYINNNTELEVADGDYSGSIVIPEEVTFMNRTRKVTNIGEYVFRGCTNLTSITIPNCVSTIGEQAFRGCTNLTSITIPSSVKTIEKYAFQDCIGLSSITIPNSVTTIGGWAFYGCSHLSSITIPNSVRTIEKYAFRDCIGLSSVTIPNSVMSIGEAVFYNCNNLTSITMSNSVTTIGEWAFYGCSRLSSITIPNSVKSIEYQAFARCTSLSSVTIPNSVTSIGYGAFYGCSHLSSITIPNSVETIESSAFRDCIGLSTVNIPNSVTSIGASAFDGADIPIVVSQIEKPYKIEGINSSNSIFSQNTYKNATLYVPVGTIDNYKATEGWKDFLFIEEGTGPEGTTPEIPKCANPTISYLNGVLTFDCKTEGATCEYSITDSDIKAGSGNEVQLTTTYDISVYAAKTGYKNSDFVTATLCWIETEPKTEDITSGVAKVSALPVLIQAQDGIITVKGINDGTLVSAYDINGKHEGVGVGNHGVANIETSLQAGSVAIVSIGMKSIKVVMR